jgi:glutamate-1-semialdehyde 2,1-aminomutase
VIAEPVVGNMGCVPPGPGFLQALRAVTRRHGAVLIFDEVMSGFRVARGGAAERYGVTPDLVTLGKVVGGGLALSALAGRADLLGMLAPEGAVYQAGTYAAHPLAVAAGLATFDAIDASPSLYATLEQRGALLEAGLESAAQQAGVAARVQRVGSMWTLFFTDRPVRGWANAAHVDRDRFATFFRAMLRQGVLLPPSPFESAFLSASHGDAEIDATIGAARAAFREIAR